MGALAKMGKMNRIMNSRELLPRMLAYALLVLLVIGYDGALEVSTATVTARSKMEHRRYRLPQ